MSNEFLTFRRFTDPELASEMVDMLRDGKIPFRLEDASPNFDVAFSFNPLDKELHLKIRSSDFEKVEKLLRANNTVKISELPKDYYLLEFSDDELFEILAKPDEWSSTDYSLARELLEARGKEVSMESLRRLEEHRNLYLAQPKNENKIWIPIGYMVALLGGLLGIFIGWHLLVFKKTLPNGVRIYGYSPSERQHGKIILIIGLIVLPLTIYFRYFI